MRVARSALRLRLASGRSITVSQAEQTLERLAEIVYQVWVYNDAPEEVKAVLEEAQALLGH